MKRNLFLLFASVGLLSTLTKGQSFINPSGYYSLDSKTTKDSGETYGYFGSIKVKLVDSNRIFADFYICKGAPGYNTGSFQDTLLCRNGIAAYTITEDNTCIVTFNFNASGGVAVEEKTKDSNSGCGFGKGVKASGFYKRIVGQNTSKKPSGKDSIQHK